MILITGVARSGTSLTTRILQMHGCRLGKAVNNLYENTDIRQGILKPHLRSVGADPLGQSVLPDTDSLKPVPGLREKVLALLTETPRAYKDAKLTLVWTVWRHAFPEAKWVLVRRNPERIIDSCIRTHFMRGHGTSREGWRKWIAAHERRFDAMKAAGLGLIEIRPADYIADPEAFRPVAEHCGLVFDRAAVESAIDRRQWHG